MQYGKADIAFIKFVDKPLSMRLMYSNSTNIGPKHLDGLWSSIGWKKRGAKKWKEVLSKTSFCVSVWDGRILVGFGRVLEDGVMCMFYDIGVHSKYQRKGIGTKIMKKLIEKVKDKKYVSIGLFAWESNPQNIPFYEKFGFERVGTGMELVQHMRRE